MRIAEVNDVAFVASEIGRGLRARGHDVTLIQPRLVGARLHWALKPAVGPVRATEWGQLAHRLRAGAFDVVHIHYAYLGIVGVLAKVPYVLHCHGTDLRELTPFTRPVTERALSGASYVFYSTPDLADYLDPWPGAEFLPNPIDAELFRPLAPARESRDVLVICGLGEIKGSPRIYEACRRLLAVRPDIKVTAIAAGEDVERFSGLANVRLVPHQDRQALPALVSRYGVVVGQAFLGVIGMAELEAMACARPVVAWFNRRDGYPERPPVIRALDGHDIAEAVIRLVDDADLREQVGNASRSWVRRFHDFDAAVDRVEAVASEVAVGAGRQLSPSR